MTSENCTVFPLWLGIKIWKIRCDLSCLYWSA